MKNTLLKFGSIGGTVISVLMVLSFPFMKDDFDNPISHWIGYGSMIIAFSSIYLGVKDYRNKTLNGRITLGMAFLTGLYLTLIIATFYVCTWMILSGTIAPDFMANYTNSAIKKIRNSGLSQEEIELQIAQMKNMMELYKNPLFKILITYAEIVPVGLLVSLISSALLKKK